MPTPPYIELHCHSGFSFLDGASHPEELVFQALELGYPAMALTDHNGLYGSMEFAQAARAEGLQPITGAEVTVALDIAGIPEGLDGLSSGSLDDPDGDPLARGCHMTLLAETPTGYANLCRLLSEAHHQSERGRPTLLLSSLFARTEGLVALTGCRRGPLSRALEDSVATAEFLARRLHAAFGPRGLFVELHDNEQKGDGYRKRSLGRLADRLGIPVVATGNVHYHRPERHRLQDVMVAIRNRTTLNGSHEQRRTNARFYLAGPEEMAHRFRSRPDAVAHTLEISERCAAFDLTKDLGYTFPDFDGSDRGEAIETLTAVCLAKLDERYRGSKLENEARDRLHQELELVDRHGLSGFFLVYRDIMELARDVAAEIRGGSPRAHAGLPPGRGRGSSVSSIICYLIGLSHVDPVKTNLFLGRFLNEAMRSVPDIDLDFPRDIREELILRVYKRYGSEHAGLVCTFPTYRQKSTLREIGKALDLPMGDLEKLSKLADQHSGGGLLAELERLPEFREKAGSPLWRALCELADDIKGLPRHISQHPGGMIISSRPLVEIVPLEPAAWKGRVLCQWDKDSCDDAGFIKIDFLALGMLSLVEEAVDLISERHGRAPDLSRINFADEALYEHICTGDTIGTFQVESRAQIQMLRRVQPRNLEDLAVQVAIVRPGPIVGGAVNPYVRRRELLREDPNFRVPYDHPLLEEALGETLGVIIFQDQVLQVCQALAGFSDGQAESLRRAMSRKRSKEAMDVHWEAFRDGARERGVDETTAQKVFQQVTAFSEFGFPKSHAAAFGLLAYQSVWLRYYHGTEFYVALFNNQPMGFYSLDALGRDARCRGIGTRLPNINQSRVKCTPEESDIRIGLGFIRGWGAEIAERVVEERERHGHFVSLSDFLRRTPASLKRPAVENLIWVGGFESFGMTRRELLWQAGLWLGPEEDSERSGGRDDHPQTELGLEDPYARIRFPDLDDSERMVAEYRMLRFSTDLHPLSLLRDELPPETVTGDRFSDLPNHSTVTVAGIVVARQRPHTAKGYVFVLMEDESGPINVIVKPKIYEKCRTTVRMEPFLVVRGRLQKDGLTTNVIAHTVKAIRVREAEQPGGEPAEQPEVLHPALLGTLESWAGQEHSPHAPFRYLTALRQSPPGIKNFG
jgi:error-prone DNA polymerase